jgi:hypothetical protein
LRSGVVGVYGGNRLSTKDALNDDGAGHSLQQPMYDFPGQVQAF